MKKEEIRICTGARNCTAVDCAGQRPHLCESHLEYWSCGFNKNKTKVRCIKVKK